MYSMQPTLIDLELADGLAATTKLAKLIGRLEKACPFEKLKAMIAPVYNKDGKSRGRPRIPLDMMMRGHILQIANNLSDRSIQDLLNTDFQARWFVGLFSNEKAPDETSFLRFRRLLENNKIGQKFFEYIVSYLKDAGLIGDYGRIVDGSFIEAPTSTKNKDHARDPEMHSGKKGNTWHFGMKIHISVDALTGMVVRAAFGPANEHDIKRAPELLRDDDFRYLYADAGYLGIEKREESEFLVEKELRINIRPGTAKKSLKIIKEYEKLKSQVRCKVEWVFKRIKVDMGYRKTRYRGIAKNAHRLIELLALVNIFLLELSIS